MLRNAKLGTQKSVHCIAKLKFKGVDIMGMYTGLRFKGIVKEQFRKEFKNIALLGEWEESRDKVFKQFSEVSRSGCIPCGALTYMPSSWEKAPYDDYGCGAPSDGFDTTYDEQTGRWTFQCSLKNYDGTIKDFFNIVPYFIESLEIAEVYYEECEWSTLYALVNEKMEISKEKYIQYGEY